MRAQILQPAPKRVHATLANLMHGSCNADAAACSSFLQTRASSSSSERQRDMGRPELLFLESGSPTIGSDWLRNIGIPASGTPPREASFGELSSSNEAHLPRWFSLVRREGRAADGARRRSDGA